MPKSLDSFKCRSVLTVDGKDYVYFSLPKAEANGLKGVSKLPYSMKVLLENLLRFEDGQSVTKEHILAVSEWLNNKGLPPRPRSHAGLYRRSCRGRSCCDA